MSSGKWKAQNEWKKRNPERHAAYALSSYYRNHESRKQRNRDRWKQRGDRYKKAAIIKKYGLTIDEYDLLFVNQNGVCSICGEPEIAGRTLAVDHCHETGKVRALLCASCNGGLGLFSDDIEILEKAIRYLKSHKQKEIKQEELV